MVNGKAQAIKEVPCSKEAEAGCPVDAIKV
jgi:ferredoxin